MLQLKDNTKLKLNEKVMKSFKNVKEFQSQKVNCIDFSFDGDTLICSNDDGYGTINLYDCKKGEYINEIGSRKYGAGIVRSTRIPNTVLYSSTKENDTLRYLSLKNKEYIRYYAGHTDKVTSISISPVDDIFMSTAEDRSLRIWDLKSDKVLGIMPVPGTRPVVSFDPEGLIFALGFNSDTLKLYNVHSFETGPFSTFTYPKIADCEWTDLKFSPNGSKILISTNGNVIHLIDAFNGTLLETFVTGSENRHMRPIEASFTPDSQYIMSGSTDRKVNVWHTESRKKIVDLFSTQSEVQFVKFNPRYMLFATACNSMTFWLPEAL